MRDVGAHLELICCLQEVQKGYVCFMPILNHIFEGVEYLWVLMYWLEGDGAAVTDPLALNRMCV